jgi:hypothetical protein
MKIEVFTTTHDPDRVMVARVEDIAKEMGLVKVYLHSQMAKDGQIGWACFKPADVLDIYIEPADVGAIVLVQHLIYGSDGSPMYEAGVFSKKPGESLLFNKKEINPKAVEVLGVIVAHNLTRDL